MRPVSLRQWLFFFFRAEGRISRREYGLGVLFVYLAGTALLLFVLARTAGADSLPPVVLLLDVPLFIAVLMLAAKRCHDINLAGTYALILMIPLAGVVWLVALAIINGTPGPNAFGPEPNFTA